MTRSDDKEVLPRIPTRLAEGFGSGRGITFAGSSLFSDADSPSQKKLRRMLNLFANRRFAPTTVVSSSASELMQREAETHYTLIDVSRPATDDEPRFLLAHQLGPDNEPLLNLLRGRTILCLGVTLAAPRDRAVCEFFAHLTRSEELSTYVVGQHDDVGEVALAFPQLIPVDLGALDGAAAERLLEAWLDELWWACWDTQETRKAAGAATQLGSVFAAVIDEVTQHSALHDLPEADVRRRDIVNLYSRLCRVIDTGRAFSSAFGGVTRARSQRLSGLHERLENEISEFGNLLLEVNLELIDIYDPGIALTIRRSIGADMVMAYVIKRAVGSHAQDPRLQGATTLLRDHYDGDGYWAPALYTRYLRKSMSEHIGDDLPLLRDDVLRGVGSLVQSLDEARARLAGFLRDHWSLSDHASANADDLPTSLGELQHRSYQSCFLSFSFRDKRFALKLYRDLQQAGVDVYYAPQDAPPGQYLMDELMRGTRRREKTILLCSRNSLESSWVETELRETLLDQVARGRPRLIPVLIDDHLFEWRNSSIPSEPHPLKGPILQMIAVDLRSPERYTTEMRKLLEALKVEGDGAHNDSMQRPALTRRR